MLHGLNLPSLQFWRKRTLAGRLTSSRLTLKMRTETQVLNGRCTVLERLNEKGLKTLLKTTIFLPVKEPKTKTLAYQGKLFYKNNSLPVMLLMLLLVHQFLFLLFLQQVDIFPFNKNCTSGFGQNKCIYN